MNLAAVLPEEYVFMDQESTAKRRDPWATPIPNPTKTCTLSYMLSRPFLGIMAAHILAHDKNAKLWQQVRYENNYKRCGRAHVYDVECNGILYRHHDSRIYSKKVGK